MGGVTVTKAFKMSCDAVELVVSVVSDGTIEIEDQINSDSFYIPPQLARAVAKAINDIMDDIEARETNT